MLCEECGKNPATVHFKKVINGNVTEMHLCEECAKKKKEFDTSFSIHNFLTGLLDDIQEGPVKVDYIQATKCDKCGMTYGKFRQTGRFGCNHCYEAFKEKLTPLFKNIHGHEEHIGKVPKKAGGVIRIRKEIQKLKNQLNIAVKNEQFEKAAELRDRIKELEAEIEG
ncbi:UvrB/UvrC motif-containing protein [Caldisalinibacter kiritimatiensis]|uniref:Nucleotide excision repair protein n=1 Tax=Caldisalinibacter kiritimatiensis TaxID=1304284 RepID=R1AU15_9FIRM|nr:UvrB/UvrC motif-containing protein [Caldisalinibacter kiritimatiensis]EOD00643.1 Nucleotide excision repair protein [Caldisalinibacter kiritimatiensis]